MIYRRAPRTSDTTPQVINPDGVDTSPPLAFATIERRHIDAALNEVASYLAAGVEPVRFFIIDSIAAERRS